MASYHLSAKIIGRSDGRSVVAAASYRAGEMIERHETGQTSDYRRKSGVVSADLLLPVGAPEWAADRAQLWNAVEAIEKRKNSQLAREIEVALPNELPADVARDLVLSWARDELVSRGMVADVCIHDPEPAPGVQRNRHAHILCTVREFDGEGWSKTKNRTWNDKGLLLKWRESWAKTQNAALELHGCSDRVDHRSLEDQREAALQVGDLESVMVLDRPPEPHLGVAAGAVEKRERVVAARHCREYRPVTARGQALYEARQLRGALFQGFQNMKLAARNIIAAVKASADLEMWNRMAQKQKTVSRSEEPPEESGSSLTF